MHTVVRRTTKQNMHREGYSRCTALCLYEILGGNLITEPAYRLRLLAARIFAPGFVLPDKPETVF